MASGMSIASDNLRHSSSMFILLRAVQICVALLMWTEAESEKVESERAELNMGVGFRWETCGGMSIDGGSISESINMLGGLEGLPA